jgi:hypothetical protein
VVDDLDMPEPIGAQAGGGDGGMGPLGGDVGSERHRIDGLRPWVGQGDPVGLGDDQPVGRDVTREPVEVGPAEVGQLQAFELGRDAGLGDGVAERRHATPPRLRVGRVGAGHARPLEVGGGRAPTGPDPGPALLDLAAQVRRAMGAGGGDDPQLGLGAGDHGRRQALLEPGVLMGPGLVDHGQVEHLRVLRLLPGAVMPCRLPLCQRMASAPRWRRRSNSP